MATEKSSPIKRCIYCGTGELPAGVTRFGDEHIFPLGLGGTRVLAQAACRSCERTINKEIETPLLTKQYGTFRAKNKLPTRNPKRRKTFVELRGVNGEQVIANVSEYPAPIPIYNFGTAGILGGREERLDKTSGVAWDFRISADESKYEGMYENYPGWNKNHSITLRPDVFARFVAKVAHGALFWFEGIGICYPTLPDIILGKNPNYLRYIGGSMDGYPNRANKEQPWELHIVPGSGYAFWPLVIDLRIFGKESFPSYHALAGWVDPQNDAHMRVFREKLTDGSIVNVAI